MQKEIRSFCKEIYIENYIFNIQVHMVSIFQVDFIFQISIFVVLAIGMIVQRKRKIKAHAQLMLAAVLLNLVSFIAVMGPALDNNIGDGTTGVLGTVAMGHVGSGALALLLSFWIVGSWLLSPILMKPLRISCYGSLNKKVMWAILLLWLTSLILGFFLYLMVNTNLLGSFPIQIGGN
jgi:uncharacterized membrane protein YozB (DUF420 family)